MNFEYLAQNLLIQSRSLVPNWLPDGKIQGHEYVCGCISGGNGDSFKVNLNTGLWAEFAGDLKGGDLISLYAAIKRISQSEAYKRLGGALSDVPSMRHPTHGAPAAFWVYKDVVGVPILYIARYNTQTGKDFLPWRKIGSKWRCKSLPSPRPLYGLDLLALRPTAHILIVEGEKTADAARLLAPGFVVITWPHGAKAWQKVDWAPVYGRSEVVLWPDADIPGVQAMRGIAKLLVPRCPNIKILNVSGKADGWDAANAVDEV